MAPMTTNMLTYEDAPVYTLMEEELFRATRRRIGYPDNGDGLICPGGSIGVMSSMHIAKLNKFPNIRAKGLSSDIPNKLVIFMSKNAHYCSNKGCILQGLLSSQQTQSLLV